MPEANLDLLMAMVQRSLDKLADHDRRFDSLDARMIGLEKKMTGLRYEAVGLDEAVLNKQDQIDHLSHRIGAIERRLEGGTR